MNNINDLMENARLKGRVIALQAELESERAEVARLRSGSFTTAVPSEDYERMKEQYQGIIDQHLAENARLQADVNELADGLKLASEVGIKIADEVTRLQAEVERLTKLKSGADQSEAKVKRYAILGVCVEPSYEAQEVCSQMIAVPYGAWVRYEDYERLLSENALVRQESDRHYGLWVERGYQLAKLRVFGIEMGKHLPDTDEANRAYINFEVEAGE